MKQDYNFEIKNVDEIDMLEILKPALSDIFTKQLHSPVLMGSITLVMRDGWVKKEADNKEYKTKHLHIEFHPINNFGYKQYYVIKLTPFNCYFCDRATHKKGLVNPSKYPDQRDEYLTRFYRRKMQELYGETWTNAFNEYIERIKKHKRDILDEAYQESIREIEDTIAEEQTF